MQHFDQQADIQWLFNTHIPAHIELAARVEILTFEGNEDSPDNVKCFDENHYQAQPFATFKQSYEKGNLVMVEPEPARRYSGHTVDGAVLFYAPDVHAIGDAACTWIKDKPLAPALAYTFDHTRPAFPYTVWNVETFAIVGHQCRTIGEVLARMQVNKKAGR